MRDPALLARVMSQDQEQGRFETRAIHAGQEPDPQNGAVMTPVYFTSTYKQDAPRQAAPGLRVLAHQQPDAHRARAEPRRARGRTPGACASAPASPRPTRCCDRLRARRPRRRGQRPLRRHLPPASARSSSATASASRFVDTDRRARAVESAIEEKTRYVYLETPTNPLLRITDIAAVRRRSRTRAASSSSSTTRSRRRSCSGRSSSARTSCCTR